MCGEIMEEMVDAIEKLCDEVETVNGFCYLIDKPNALVVVKRHLQQE